MLWLGVNHSSNKRADLRLSFCRASKAYSDKPRECAFSYNSKISAILWLELIVQAHAGTRQL